MTRIIIHALKLVIAFLAILFFTSIAFDPHAPPELHVLGLGVLVLSFYLIPWFIAKARDTHNSGGILILNLVLGWTLAGWAVVLIIACVSRSKSHAEVYP